PDIIVGAWVGNDKNTPTTRVVGGDLPANIWRDFVGRALPIISKASPQVARRNVWDHNGSIVYLVAQGRFRKFYYKEPRSGMVSAGAKPGSLLFDGEVIGDQYQGTAYIFNGRCG